MAKAKGKHKTYASRARIIEAALRRAVHGATSKTVVRLAWHVVQIAFDVIRDHEGEMPIAVAPHDPLHSLLNQIIHEACSRELPLEIVVDGFIESLRATNPTAHIVN